jgi:hypothetical protein
MSDWWSCGRHGNSGWQRLLRRERRERRQPTLSPWSAFPVRSVSLALRRISGTESLGVGGGALRNSSRTGFLQRRQANVLMAQTLLELAPERSQLLRISSFAAHDCLDVFVALRELNK